MNNKFGQLIKVRRLEYGFNQASLARRVGISPSYLCKLEKGERDNLCGFALVKLCMALNISFNEMIGSDDEGI